MCVCVFLYIYMYIYIYIYIYFKISQSTSEFGFGFRKLMIDLGACFGFYRDSVVILFNSRFCDCPVGVNCP